MAEPTVTVCIPTYNYAHYLGAAIASVLDQTFGDFELLIADDASSDNTDEVVQEFLDDPRVRYLPNEVNSGMFANFNRCVEQARGRYIKFVMADDWLAARCLEESVALLEAHPGVNLVTVASWLIDDANDIYASEFQFPFHETVVDRSRVIDHFADGANVVGMPTCALMRTDALKAAGGFDSDYAPAADVDLWFRLLADSDLGWIDEELAYLRIHTDHTHAWGDDPNESWLRVWRDAPARSRGVVTADQMDFALGRWSTKHSTFAVKHLLAGRVKRSWQLWRAASSQVGLTRTLKELAGSLPQTFAARRTARTAARQGRLIRYAPTAQLGHTLDEERQRAETAQGAGLRRQLSDG